jgi:branched-chain amino acid transport system substrate-binding protein
MTRGFLFADLRGYTAFTEAHGAAAAAMLLERYRVLVRGAIEHFEGSEIRTEGDSFYVVFGSVSAAVRCGLAIVEAAEGDRTSHPESPIRVGVGVHAGETVETAEGYVGTPVNLAARICAQARPGEVLVSDTVRALTQTVLSVRFEPRGRKQLKGIGEPVSLFSAIAVDSTAAANAATARSRWRLSGRGVATLVTGGLILAAAAAFGWTALRPASLPPGPWRVAISLPLSGDLSQGERGGEAMRDAVSLAISEANAAGGLGGVHIELVDYDSAAEEVLPGKAAPSPLIERVASDGRVIALIGPWSSPLAFHQVPVTNEAGLLQCSPSATDPGLTKPRDGALDLRSAHPDRINFVRPVAADDINATAMATYAFDDLGIARVLVVDDTLELGRAVADNFEAAFRAKGGETIRRALNVGSDPASVLAELSSSQGDAPQAVFFGGFTATGAAKVRRAMTRAGHGDLPFLSWDGIFDGAASDDGSFINRAGSAAVGSLLAHSGLPAPRSDFVDRFRAAYGSRPSEYTAAAYACAEVILESLRAVADSNPSAGDLREAVRAYATDPGHTFGTVLGSLSFDANGDSTAQFVTFYGVEPGAAGGDPEWRIEDTRVFPPSP